MVVLVWQAFSYGRGIPADNKSSEEASDDQNLALTVLYVLTALFEIWP